MTRLSGDRGVSTICIQGVVTGSSAVARTRSDVESRSIAIAGDLRLYLLAGEIAGRGELLFQ